MWFVRAMPFNNYRRDPYDSGVLIPNAIVLVLTRNTKLIKDGLFMSFRLHNICIVVVPRFSNASKLV